MHVPPPQRYELPKRQGLKGGGGGKRGREGVGGDDRRDDEVRGEEDKGGAGVEGGGRGD